MHPKIAAVAIPLLLAWIPACGTRPTTQDDSAAVPPELVVSDPASVAKWEASRRNVFRSKLEVVPLKGFRDKLTEKGNAEAKPVGIELCGALDSGVAAEQAECLKRLVAEEQDLYTKVRAAIYREYQRSYGTYKQADALGSAFFGGDAKETSQVLPEIVKGNELDGLVSFNTIYISRPEKGVSRIGVTLICPWDEEHGMGVLIAGGDVEQVGDAGTAMAGFMPRPDGLKDLKNGNVALYVANMAFRPRVIDIQVQIDGASVVSGNFEHDVQRPYTRYLVKLTSGEHRLKVSSERGQVSHEEVFQVKDQAHIALGYSHAQGGLVAPEDKPTFTCVVEDQPSIPEWAWRPGK